MSIVKNETVAEDLAQQAMVRLYSLPTMPANPNAWLRVVVRNLAIDYSRALTRNLTVEFDEMDAQHAVQKPDESEPVTPEEKRELRLQAFEQHRAMFAEILSDRHIELLRLTVAEVPQEQIAIQLGYGSAASVKTTLTRVRKALRDSGHPGAQSWLDAGGL